MEISTKARLYNLDMVYNLCRVTELHETYPVRGPLY